MVPQTAESKNQSPHQIKFKVTLKSGKSVKYSYPIQPSEKFLLGKQLLGDSSPFWIELRNGSTWMTSANDSARFYLNHEKINEAKLTMGDLWEWNGIKIEFLIVPDNEASHAFSEEEATCYLPAGQSIPQDAAKNASTPPPPPPMPSPSEFKEHELTSMILKMTVPDRIPEMDSIKNRMKEYDVSVAGGQKMFVIGNPDQPSRLSRIKSNLYQKYPITQNRKFQSLVVSVLLAFMFTLVWAQTRDNQSQKPQEVAVVNPPIEKSEPQTPVQNPVKNIVQEEDLNQNVELTDPPVQKQEVSQNDGFDPMAKEEFFSAIRSGDIGLVRYLVKKRLVDVNLSLDQGKSALHVAAEKGDVSIAKYLVSQRANLNARDPNGATPLLWAVFKKKESMVRYLVKKGADRTLAREGGDRPINIAKRYGLKSLYRILELPKSKVSTADRTLASRTSAKTKVKNKTKKTKHSQKKRSH